MMTACLPVSAQGICRRAGGVDLIELFLAKAAAKECQPVTADGTLFIPDSKDRF
jgi:hypothetical protein